MIFIVYVNTRQTSLPLCVKPVTKFVYEWSIGFLCGVKLYVISFGVVMYHLYLWFMSSVICTYRFGIYCL